MSELGSASSSETGAQRLANGRHESFCRLVAEGYSLQDAWIASANGKKYKPSPSMRVSASKAHARPEVLDRIAYLRRAQASKEPRQRLSSERLAEIMERVTEALLEAADAAKQAGAPHSQQATIKQAITRHAGRSVRFSRKAPATDQDQCEFPLAHMTWCDCEFKSAEAANA